ncbi:MAG: serine hydrolase domain-containing protein [Saprospiraceae bacterium]|nr:serine hydrolase domain-containing protein [Saprospiraceae bacterium]
MKIPIIFIFLFLSMSISAQNGLILKRVIDQLLLRSENRVDSAKVTGFVIGCLDGDSTWVFPYGRLSKTTQEAPTGATYFEIGGVSQVFIANRIYELVERKELDYAAPVNKYLSPNLQFPAGERITLLQLTTHTSGLPKLPPDMGTFEADKEQPFEEYTEGGLFEYLKSFNTTILTRNKYVYAPLNYAILEKVLEKRGMLPMSKDTNRNKIIAQGYNLAQKTVDLWRFNETFRWTVGQQANAEELLQLVKQQLGVKALQEPLFPTELNKHAFIGKAWHVMRQNKRTSICFATGTTGGHSAFVAFVPETRTGVVVLTNSRLVGGKLGMAILRILNENWKRK